MRISDWSSDVCSSDLFKFAVTAANEDRAAIRLHDIGLKLVRNDAGELGFEVYIGGGMGRTPFVAPLIRPFLPAANLFSHMEAALRVWNRGGRRDNNHKQRIQIPVNALGAEGFTRPEIGRASGRERGG